MNSTLSRLPSLTGLRFVAAFAVFANHIATEGLFRDTTVGMVLALSVYTATIGVSCFFVLSGFVLTWSAREHDTMVAFWRRRAAKIYPNHVLTWAVTLALILLFGGLLNPNTPPTGVTSAVSSLFLVHAWVPRIDVMYAMNIPSWSLSCEVFFYLMFPLLLRMFTRIRAERLWLTFGLLVGAAALVPLAAKLMPGTPLMPFPPPYTVSVPELWFVYLFPVSRCLEFAAGIVMALIVRNGKWIGMRRGWTYALVFVAYVVELSVPMLFGFAAPAVGPLALCVAAIAVADLSGQRSRLRGSVMVWLGGLSFAFYLVHHIVIRFGHALLAGGQGSWDTPTATAIALGMFAVSLGLAWLMYRYWEVPAMRFLAGDRRSVEVRT